MSSRIKGLYGAANRVIMITGGIIFGWLLWYAMKYTNYMIPLEEERSLVMQDAVWKNLLGILVFCLLFFFLSRLEKKLSKKIQNIIICVFVFVAVSWTFFVCHWWVCAVERTPEADQLYLSAAASYFLEGDYFFLNPPGGYLAVYPYQKAFTFLLELLYRIYGAFDYFAVQKFLIVFPCGIVLAGYLVLREITDSMAAAVSYSLLMMACLPLFFYTPWIYGDVPSVFFMLVTTWMLMRCAKTGRSGWIVGIVVFATLGLMVRKNCSIYIAALCMVAAVGFVCRKEKKIMVAALLSVLVPWLVYMGIYKMYEVRSGYEQSSGLPTITWFDMGMHDRDGSCGWEDTSAISMYVENGMDAELTKEAARKHIREHLETFRKNPAYTAAFYREKVLSQWNVPTYQSLFFTANYRPDNRPAEGSLALKVSTDDYFTVLEICGLLQIIIFCGMFLYFVLAVRADSHILQHVLAVNVIGVFLFSIIWEAKSRYIFPCYITMFPIAVAGYRELYLAAGRGIKLILERRQEVQKGKESRNADNAGS
ncbi:MAG: ArnT family glycosyltransferase [Acetatifactor sp.]